MSEIDRPGDLAKAAELFAARGFHGTSGDDIARLAGISSDAMSEAFGDKEGLFYAALEFARRHLDASVHERMVESMLPRARKAAMNPKLRIFHRDAIERLDGLKLQSGD